LKSSQIQTEGLIACLPFFKTGLEGRLRQSVEF